MKIATCALCLSTGKTRYRTGSRRVDWCQPCSLGFTVPSPVVDYTKYTSGPRVLEQWLRYGKEIVDFALGVTMPSSWLDFGAGGGELLLAARMRGVDRLVGVDLDEAARHHGMQRGIEMHESLGALGDAAFAVISASHVLEHVADPIAVIAELGTFLEPNGILIVAQPNPNGLLPRLAPKYWSGWVLTEHRWHFTSASMKTIFERSGLRLVETKNSTLDHQLKLQRSLPFDVLGKVGFAAGLGDQFLAMGRLA